MPDDKVSLTASEEADLRELLKNVEDPIERRRIRAVFVKNLRGKKKYRQRVPV